MDEKRVADYFVVAGVSESKRPLEDYFGRDGSTSPPIFSSQPSQEPITDITVIIRSQGEAIPPGWICIENTPCGFPADLNHGSIRSPEIFICYKRGRDKAPLVDVGVLYEGKERVMADSEVVYSTLLGKAANVNNSGSRTFLTYRRAKANAPCNQLVVMDICVILMNKGENPPHAFCLVQKNLNKGMVGSDVYLCYKKSMNRPPLLRYQPEILGRYPMQDYPGYSLPESVPLFCMPMGATIESWPKKCQQPRPVFSTFVLTSDTAVKVYGAAVTFYESYPSSKLTREEKELLEYETEKEEDEDKSLNAVKSICILSRWPFFDTFEKFLLFLYKSMANSMQKPLSLPIEMFISHFMLEVPFPSSQRPKILVQLISTSDETVLISQPPEDMPLPLSGASFSQMLRNLGPDNCLNVLLLALSEQKMLLHSLRPDVLTGVAEAVTSIMFPFHWQCPYIPLCPLGLCDVLNAPLPFIVGVDSRYFDLFVPPVDVACVDLDTNSIYLSESKKSLNQKALPKRPARILKATLEEIFQRLVRPQVMCNGSGNSGGAYSGQSVKRGSTAGYSIDSISVKKFERQIDLEIQEAFVRFMSSCLKDFRSYLRPITRAPSVGATDPSSLFDLSGFLKSRDKNYQRFYQILMRTQMFARFIEERSFVSDKNISLAFFDECLDKIETVPDADSSATLKFLDPDDTLKNDRTVFIPAPESSPDQKSEFSYKSFGPLDVSLFHAHPVMKSRLSLINNQNHHSTIDELSSPTKSTSASAATIESPMSRRTKQEIRMSQRIAKRHAESPLTWAKCLVSYVYSLWFIHLPAYFKMIQSRDQSSSSTKESSLRLALEVLMRMQSLNLHPPDEICYRVLMLMCGEYSQPALAVKVLFEMRQNGVIPNAITYGYYNKAVLESKWPAGDTTAALLWSRLRNVVTGVHRFKKMGQERQEKFAKLNAAKEALIQGFNKSSNRTDVTTVGGTGAQQVQVMTPGNTTSDDVSSVESDFVKTESGSNDLGYCSTTTQEIITPEKPLLNIKRESVDDSVIHRKNPDAVDFSESNAFRIKTRSIVRQSSNASVTITTGLQEYDSPAGVLMTSSPSSLLNDDVFSSPESVTRRQNSARRSSKTRSLQSSDVPTPESSSSTGDKKETTEGTSRPYLRSYSFGSDTKIIKKLKEGTLKALKHELERNHQMVPEEDLQTDQPASTDVAQKSVTQKSSDEALVKSSQESVQNKTDDSDISQEIIMTTVTPLKTNRSASVDSQVKNQRAHSSDDILTSTLTPIKDAIGNYTGNLFSPEGKVASSFKSGFKFASRLASPTKTATGSRAKMASFSLIRSKTLTERDEPPNSRTAALTRSATLPAGVDGTSCINEMLSVDIKETDVENQKPDEVEKSDKSSEKSSVGSTETMEKIGDKLSVTGVSSSSSPWSNRLSGKHFEYLKSATNSMVNRISEIKSNLSTPGKPSSTSTSSSVTGSTAGTGSSFLSQWASLVAEKLPSNFSLEDDDDSSLSSFEMRRGSLALSEEDLGSCETCRSREGSSSHATHHLKSAQPSAAIPFFEMLEGHYSDILGEPKSDDVLIQIEMTSCCRCYSCSSLLFDEEIMSGWTPDDSNLNTQCVHCNSKFVPLLTIVLKDRRDLVLKTAAKKESEKDLDPLGVMKRQNSESSIKSSTPEAIVEKPFTVPYLSPLVLRKEVENVLENEGDFCSTKSSFINDHPIIFWNLIWFFERINLPSHLQGLLILHNLKNLNEEELKGYDDRHVRVTCLWDNDELHEDMRRPMYRLWSESSSRSSLLHALVTDKTDVSETVMKQILNCIQVNDMITPMKLLSNERRKVFNSHIGHQIYEKQHNYSVYRDLLFLCFVSLGRDNIDHVAFDREYRRAYEAISPKHQMVLSSADKPPSFGTIFCRRFFKKLDLKHQPSSTSSSSVAPVTSSPVEPSSISLSPYPADENNQKNENITMSDDSVTVVSIKTEDLNEQTVSCETSSAATTTSTLT